MSVARVSPSEELSGRGAHLLELGRELGVDLQPFSEEKVKDLSERIRVCDIDGLGEVAALDKKRALQLVRRYHRSVSGIDERRILRTPDARRLGHEILSLFAQQASSKLAKNRLLLLVPSVDRKVIQNRLSLCATGTDLFRELRERGGLDDLKKILADIFFASTSGKSSARAGGSDILQYFLARKRIIQGVKAILTKFEGYQKLGSFWKGIEGEHLDVVGKKLEEVEGSKVQDAEAVLSDAEMLVNDKLRKGRIDQEKARSIIENQVEEAATTLKMNSEEEQALRKAAFEGLSIPFEFERAAKKRLVERWEQRQREEMAARLTKAEASLRGHWDLVADLVERVVLLDQMLAIASVTEMYSLTTPVIGNEGIGFVSARSLTLAKEQLEGSARAIQSVSYSLGRTRSIRMAKPRNVVMLTGANSGGKTTLLTTLATIHILTLLGLTVPCERAEVAPMPIYLFRRRATRKIGSLEQALSSFIPVFADRHRKLILMDEFEALTEPGASGRIIATVMNAVAVGNSLLLIVTHLARETLPHVKLPIRVDGIEATGLDDEGELIVDRQPKFNHIGSSTPKLIIMKLSKTARKKNVKALYDDVLSSLGGDSLPLQTPLALPWIAEESD